MTLHLTKDDGDLMLRGLEDANAILKGIRIDGLEAAMNAKEMAAAKQMLTSGKHVSPEVLFMVGMGLEGMYWLHDVCRPGAPELLKRLEDYQVYKRYGMEYKSALRSGQILFDLCAVDD